MNLFCIHSVCIYVCEYIFIVNNIHIFYNPFLFYINVMFVLFIYIFIKNI